MWTRAELKGRAKACLRKYYWMAFLASLIASLLGGGLSGGTGFRSSANLNRGRSSQPEISYDTGQMADAVNWSMILAVIAVVGVVILVAFVIGVVWNTFMSNVVRVGCCRYFMESRDLGASAGLGRLFCCFTQGKYLNVVKVMFMRDLFTFLWGLLLVIPGIIKSYEYYMVPYILSENPDIDYRDALKLSRDMMDGHKFSLFVLQWSFIGWEFLGALCCGIGILFVHPYENATYAELYAVLRKNSKAVGTLLPGYGIVTETADTVDTDYIVY